MIGLPWLQAVLAVPMRWIDGDACGGMVWLVHEKNLIDRLESPQPRHPLDKKQIQLFVSAMRKLVHT